MSKRLFFIGSLHDKSRQPETGAQPTEADKPLFQAARELGYATAAAGHTMLIGSDSKNTIDYYLASGAAEFGEAHPNTAVTIEVHRPNDKKTPYQNVPGNINIVRKYYYQDESNPHKWIVTHVRMLDSCDAVVALGGDTSTRLVGNIAADRKRPVLAVSSFGGAASELYDRLQYLYPHLAPVDSIDCLVSPWMIGFGDKVVSLATALAETSTEVLPKLYFLSYSWGDKETADHVEAVLRRKNRNVLRDEDNLKSGEPLSGAIEALIAQSDCFIALWSTHYKSSTWCPKELEYARNCQAQGKKPSRIILLKLDDTDVPIRFVDTLHRPASSREERAYALMQLLHEEREAI
jgi:hypothetical protein